jgi:hypothetical protein
MPNCPMAGNPQKPQNESRLLWNPSRRERHYAAARKFSSLHIKAAKGQKGMPERTKQENADDADSLASKLYSNLYSYKIGNY